jgi:hypothetical protein
MAWSQSIGCQLLHLWLSLHLRQFRGSAEICFQRRQLRLNFLRGFALADDFVAIPPQEVIDSLDADLDRARRLIFVEILKAEVRCSGLFGSIAVVRRRENCSASEVSLSRTNSSNSSKRTATRSVSPSMRNILLASACMPSIPLRRRNEGSTARWGQPRNLAISFDSSVFDVPGGPKKMADRGVPFLTARPFATPSASATSGLTNSSNRKLFRHEPHG